MQMIISDFVLPCTCPHPSGIEAIMRVNARGDDILVRCTRCEASISVLLKNLEFFVDPGGKATIPSEITPDKTPKAADSRKP